MIPAHEEIPSPLTVIEDVSTVVAYLIGIPGSHKPSEALLKKYEYLITPITEEWPETLISVSVHDEAKRRWRGELEAYPELFSHLSAGLSDLHSSEASKVFDERFQEFQLVREAVHEIASQAEQFRERPDEPMDIRIPLSIRIDGTDGTIRVRSDWYIEAFNGVNLAKLHRCKAMIKTTDASGRVVRTECNNVFWQKPAHKKACSKECSNILAGRKHRKKAENIQKAKYARAQYGWGNEKKGAK